MLLTERLLESREEHIQKFRKELQDNFKMDYNPGHTGHNRYVTSKISALHYLITHVDDPNISPELGGEKTAKLRRHLGFHISENGYGIKSGIYLYHPETGKIHHHEGNLIHEKFEMLNSNYELDNNRFKTVKQNYLPHNLRNSVPSLPLDHIGALHHSLTDATVGATMSNRIHLQKYTDDSANLNNFLMETGHLTPEEKVIKHGKNYEKYREIANNIKSVKTILPRDMYVYSGIGTSSLDHFIDTSIGHGAKFHNSAFISSSILPSIAAYNYGRSFYTDYGRLLRFKLPQGYDGGAYIARDSVYPHEHEFLIHADQNWRYTGTSVHHIKNHEGEKHIPFHMYHFEPQE